MNYLENSTLECDSCGYTIHGDTPSIAITCDNCIAEKEMFENMDTQDRLLEVDKTARLSRNINNRFKGDN